MKKYIVLFVLVLCMSLFQVAFGQGPKFGIGGIVAFPTGDWSDLTSSVGFGGTGQVLFPFGENMAIGAQAGYITFGGETVEAGVPGFGTAKYDYTISAIPILGIFRYYLTPAVVGTPRWFVGGLAGFHLMQIKWEYTETILGVEQTFEADGNSTEFTIAPMGGVAIGGLEITAFYMIISDANYFGGRIGFNFGSE